MSCSTSDSPATAPFSGVSTGSGTLLTGQAHIGAGRDLTKRLTSGGSRRILPAPTRSEAGRPGGFCRDRYERATRNGNDQPRSLVGSAGSRRDLHTQRNAHDRVPNRVPNSADLTPANPSQLRLPKPIGPSSSRTGTTHNPSVAGSNPARPIATVLASSNEAQRG
jgi:hypothetical protein